MQLQATWWTAASRQITARESAAHFTRGLSNSRPACSSWPSDAKGADEDEHEQPQQAPRRSSYSQADPDDPQVPSSGGHAYAPTMKGMSIKKSLTASSAFSSVQNLMDNAKILLLKQNAAREEANAKGTSRSRAGPSMQTEPPPISPTTDASPSALDAATSGPCMPHMSNSRPTALPNIGSSTASTRSAAIVQAGRVVSAISRSQHMPDATNAGAQAALERMEGVHKQDTRVRNVAQRAAEQGAKGVGNEHFGCGMHPLPPPPPRQKTLFYLESLKKQNTPIVALTAFDYPSSLAVRSADVDLCLVGDSLANVALGYPTTRHVSLQEMIFACQAVQRGLGSPILAASARFASPLVVCDLPFGTFEVSVEEGTRAALRIIQEGKVDAIKIEGGEEIYPLVRTLTKFGIPVMGHVGLQPQKVSSTSGYRVQGRLARDAFTIYKQALELQAAGVFSLVLECVPSKLARYITENLDIPTIGIGAGSGTDGQVLVQSDMVGELTSPAHVLAGLAEAGSSESKQDPPLASNGKQVPVPHPNAPRPPKFVRTFTPGNSTIGALRQAAVQAYTEAVRRRDFPSEGAASNDQAAAAARAEEGPAPTGESYRMKKEEWAGFLELVAKDR